MLRFVGGSYCENVSIKTLTIGVKKMNDWIMRLFGLVVTVISPELRKGLEEWLTQLEERAKKTPNPWDDVFVGILKSVLLNK